MAAGVLFDGLTFSRPSHMRVDRKAVFDTGKGRRYIRRSAALGGVAQPSRSSAETSRKSAVEGMPSSIRTRALLSISVELALGWLLGTPAARQSEPSNTNRGSSRRRLRAKSGVMVQPRSSWWQVPQVRSLVPKSSKNGLLVWRAIGLADTVLEAPMASPVTSVNGPTWAGGAAPWSQSACRAPVVTAAVSPIPEILGVVSDGSSVPQPICIVTS